MSSGRLEYFMYGKVSDKIDVFAFGVVLLELLTGRRPISDHNPKGQESLVMWATPILERGDFMELLDPNVKENYDEILSLLQGEEEIEAWIGCHINATSNRLDCQDDEAFPSSSVGSHIGMALLDVDEDDASLSSFDQSNHSSLEEYLRDRWSRSSSFD
ncbi:kinase family [Musa troglodytarum]|uniref:Kinase family n=1 Tax=Musa troglodytarum TaxID=320322 RepID=A0A9E7FP30_9LILI|nr:kinase family [Musa troglodytarum]